MAKLHFAVFGVLLTASCSQSASSSIEMAEFLGLPGEHTIGDESYRKLPASLGRWHLTPINKLSTVMPRGAYEDVAELPTELRSPLVGEQMIVMISDATRPEPDPGDPYEATGEFAGLSRYVSRNPEMSEPPVRLLLPAPHQGQIDCAQGTLERQDRQCGLTFTSGRVRHTVAIRPEQISHWQAYMKAYLVFVEKVRA